MSVLVDIDNVCAYNALPDNALIEQCVTAAVDGLRGRAELCLRVVDEAESEAMNTQYRGQHKPTNVLSFPSGLPESFDPPLLGDLVICASVVAREAEEQGKTLQAHWAHMLVHGVLHLLGFDHVEDGEAELMEAREIAILKKLGFANPY